LPNYEGALAKTELVMSRAELKQLLVELEFCRALSEEALGMLAGRMKAVDFGAQASIFEEGSVHPWLYLIVEGKVGLDMNSPPRGRTRILTLGAGDLLAWSALLGDARMTASAIALENVKVLAISSSDIQGLVNLDDRFGLLLFREVAAALSKRLVATRIQLLDLFGSSSG
jgi:CRP/FNR family cyclic AMP-dependent transcriptional regulator